MSVHRRFALGLFLAVALATAFAVTSVHRTEAQQTERAKRLGGKLICMCGCNQILTACNHVGCSVSTEMLKKLDALVARNEPDDLTLQSFTQEYGLKVLAEPPAQGFNLLAWVIPIVAFLAGLGIVMAVIAHWRRRVTPAAAGAPGAAVPPEILARVERETDE